MTWYSQAGQDAWVAATFPQGYSGYFVEVGAYDGIQTSNTYALEQLGWRGLCIEAQPFVAANCARNRRCKTIAMAAAGRRGFVQFEGDRVVGSGGIQVACDTLTNMLEQVGAPPVIDYLSIDIEGGELDALSAFDFDAYHVNLMTVEHNLYAVGPEPKQALFELLVGRGFERVLEDVPCLDENPLYYMKPYEDWYMHSDVLISAP